MLACECQLAVPWRLPVCVLSVLPTLAGVQVWKHDGHLEEGEEVIETDHVREYAEHLVA